MRKVKDQQILDYGKFKHHISKLSDLKYKLEKMGIDSLNDETVMWVYLQSFPDDDILTGKYIYNFGIMDEEMKRHVGDVIDYKIYLQTIVEMSFSEFRNLYQEQAKEREQLSLEYPGLIMDIKTPNKVGRKKIEKTQEELEKQKEKQRKYQQEYFQRVTKEKRKNVKAKNNNV
jgi:hypothetical protein